VRGFVEDNVRLINGTPGDPRSFDLLDTLLADQAYRVAFWRVSSEEINYRRFFDVDQLAAIRMERADVFAETHALVARLLRESVVTGLRIDHPDGLYAPAEYFRRLQELTGPVYVVAEKILAPNERWPAAWAVAGTTGYETLNLINGIFVDRTQARALDQLYRRLTHETATFSQIVDESKRLIMETVMASEIAMLAHRLNIISERHRSTRDFTLGSLTRAVREIIAAFSVYRTYVGDAPLREGLPPGLAGRPHRRDRARSGVHHARGRPGQAAHRGHRCLGLRLDPGHSDAALPAVGRRRAPARAPRLGDAVPADHGTGDGQRLRGHRALPVSPADFPQRRRWRSGPLRHSTHGVPRRHGGPPENVPGQPHGHLDPRHQAQRGRPRPHQRAERDPAGVAPARQPLGAPESPAADRR